MANNPNVNKVEYDGQTLIDLTEDTVTANDVRSGVTFHDRSGAARQGGLIISAVYDGLDSSSTTDALSANQGRVLENKTRVQELFNGTVQFTNGVGFVPNQSINYAHYHPLYAATAMSTVIPLVSGIFDNSGICVCLVTSMGYSGPFDVQINGFGWD